MRPLSLISLLAAWLYLLPLAAIPAQAQETTAPASAQANGSEAQDGESLTAMVSDLEGEHATRREDLKDPHYLKGVYHFMNGEYEPALKEFLAGLEDNPKNPYLHYSLGYTYYKMGKPALAAQYFDSAVQLKNDEAIFQYMAGVAKYDNNDLDGSEHAFDEAIRVAGPSKYAESAKSYLQIIERQRKIQAVHKERAKKWRLKTYVSVEYDDNILLTNENLVVNGESLDDSDTLINLFLSGEYDLWSKTDRRLTARYAFFQSLHDSVDQFDFQRHSFELGYQQYWQNPWAPMVFGLRYAFYWDLLDSNDFESTHNVFADAKAFEAHNLATAFEYHYQNINSEDDRFDYLAGDTHHTDLSQLWFFHNKKGFLQLGLRFGKESRDDQEGDQIFFGRTRFLRLVKVQRRRFFRSYSFDQKGVYLNAHVPIYDQATAVDLGAEYLSKDYDDEDILYLKADKRIKDTRNDDQQRYTAALTRQLNKHFQVGLQYRHVRNDSNFDGSDGEPDRQYNQNVYGLNVTGTF